MMMLVAVYRFITFCDCAFCISCVYERENAHKHVLPAQGLEHVDIPSCSCVIERQYTITSHNADVPLCASGVTSALQLQPPHSPAPNLPIGSLASLLNYAIPCGHHPAVCQIIMHAPCGTVSTHKSSAECAASSRRSEARFSHNT